MNKFIGISLTLLFIPFYAFAQNAIKSTGSVVLFYGLLPISVFITALILSLVYSNKDERDERPVLRIAGWIFCSLNALIGLFWLISCLLEIHYAIFGDNEFRFSTIIFLFMFIFGGFHPLYIMYKADFPSGASRT